MILQGCTGLHSGDASAMQACGHQAAAIPAAPAGCAACWMRCSSVCNFTSCEGGIDGERGSSSIAIVIGR